MERKPIFTTYPKTTIRTVFVECYASSIACNKWCIWPVARQTFPSLSNDHHDSDRMAVGCTITYAISAYHHWNCEFESRSWRGALDITLCNKVCQWLAAGRWFSPGTLGFTTIKTDRHDMREILFRVTLSTKTPLLNQSSPVLHETIKITTHTPIIATRVICKMT